MKILQHLDGSREWLKKHVGKPSAHGKKRHVLCPGPSLLETLPPEIIHQIVSPLSKEDLFSIEQVSRSMQLHAENVWRLMIPTNVRTAVFKLHARPSPGIWKTAWFIQCKHLERFGPWGLKASRACKVLENKLSPYDVESQCRDWLENQASPHDTTTKEVLHILFDCIHEKYESIALVEEKIPSLPPFMSKLAQLKDLHVTGSKLTAIDLREFRELEVLYLSDNWLKEINLQDHPALKWVTLKNNRLTVAHVKDLKKLKRLDLSSNLLTNVDIRNCEELDTLWLHNNLLRDIDLRGFKKLKRLNLFNNLLAAVDLKGLPAIEEQNLSNDPLET